MAALAARFSRCFVHSSLSLALPFSCFSPDLSAFSTPSFGARRIFFTLQGAQAAGWDCVWVE